VHTVFCQGHSTFTFSMGARLSTIQLPPAVQPVPEISREEQAKVLATNTLGTPRRSNKMLALSRLTVASILALLATTSAEAANKPIQLTPRSAQTIYAPIAGLEEFANWQLAVVNRTPGSMPAVITVYSLDGTALAPVSITLNGSETRNLDIKALAPDQASKQNLGGVSISFTGATMGVGAQITISGHNGFGNVDAPLLADSTYKSNSIDAVWWAPAHAHS
jgi:hypothetical protein